MPVTISVDDLITACRVGTTDEERAEITRLRDYCIAEFSAYLTAAVYNDVPDAMLNEAAVRFVRWLYDQPNVSGGIAFANAYRSSGAGRMLYRYRVHRAGAASVSGANAAMGSAGNPVIDVDYTGDVLTIEYADGTSETFTITSGDGNGGDGTDQTARDSAEVAQNAADAAQSTADANTAAVALRLQRSDIAEGSGVTITPTAGSETGLTISATGGGGGPVDLAGTWRRTLLEPINGGQYQYTGAVTVGEIDTWLFNASGLDTAESQLLDLGDGDKVVITESATRFQTIAVTSTPTMAGNVATVSGRADRGQAFEIPQNGATVTIRLIPAPIDAIDQTARDAAATAQTAADTAQAEVDAHEVAAHNTDTTARTTANAANTAITDHIDNHPAGSGPTLAGTYTTPNAEVAQDTWISTGITVPTAATLMGVSWIDLNTYGGDLQDVDDWRMDIFVAVRLRMGKTARSSIRPNNSTRTYALRLNSNVLEFRGSSTIPAAWTLGMRVYTW